MYNEDYLCPICGEPLYELVNHDLVCENCNMTFESWECSPSMKVIMEDSREQKAIDRFYGLED